MQITEGKSSRSKAFVTLQIVSSNTLELPSLEPAVKNRPCSFQDTEFHSFMSDKCLLPFIERGDLRNERSRLQCAQTQTDFSLMGGEEPVKLYILGLCQMMIGSATGLVIS